MRAESEWVSIGARARRVPLIDNPFRVFDELLSLLRALSLRYRGGRDSIAGEGGAGPAERNGAAVGRGGSRVT